MSFNATRPQTMANKINLLDMLGEQSLAALRKFGYVYKDERTGRVRMRIYKK